MSELSTPPAVESATPPVGRRQRARRRAVMMRWLVAGVGAGMLSGLGTRASQAANGESVIVASTVDGTSPTAVRNTSGGTPPTTDTTADGLQGYAAGANNSGLLGRNNSSSGIGVTGVAPSGTGVFGESSNGYGVGGRSASNFGVYGESAAAYPGAAVYGKNTGGVGAGGAGVQGYSANSVGIYAISDSNIAVYGKASSGSGTGVYGHGLSGAQAGYFNGSVMVSGDFTVTGANKSAAVRHPDGTFRRLYCMESPESWFEDFGRGQLVGGRAQVALDPDFAALVKTSDYHVFPIPEGDCKGLSVTARSASGFEVRELQGGSSSITFSYRVVARRGDIPGPRLERVTIPPIRLPDGTDGASPQAAQPVGPSQTPLPTSTPAPTLVTPSPTSAAATPAPSATAVPTPSATPTPTALPSRTPTPNTGASPSAT